MPNGSAGEEISSEDAESSSPELLAALLRANELQATLDASVLREEALLLQVADLRQQLSSSDFIAQLKM